MSAEDLVEAMDLLTTQAAEASFVGPISEVTVQRAEAKLDLVFPPTYREFLLQLGAGNLFSAEFYGITGDNLDVLGIPNGVWLTLDERDCSSLPQRFILIADSGVGPYFAIDTGTRNEDENCPVVEWQGGLPEDRQNLKPVASDFGEFFLARIREAIANFNQDEVS